VDGEQPFELLQVRFDGRLHVRVLQLAGQERALVGARTMDLAERSGRRRLMLEAREFLLPIHPQLGTHAPLDESPSHGRGLTLQLRQLGRVFRRQHVGNGRH
jgi:hypothetical protein